MDKDEFPKQVDEYIKQRKEAGLLPTLTGLALQLGIDDLTEYGKRAPFAQSVKRLKRESEMVIIDKLMSTEKPLINHIFLAKAIAGLRDNQTLDVNYNPSSAVVVLPKRGK